MAKNSLKNEQQKFWQTKNNLNIPFKQTKTLISKN
jgi:hypothetical protein